MGFPGGSEGKASVCNAGDPGLTSELGRSPGDGNNPLQYSCLENPMDRGVCWATVCGVTKSWTELSSFTFFFFFFFILKFGPTPAPTSRGHCICHFWSFILKYPVIFAMTHHAFLVLGN